MSSSSRFVSTRRKRSRVCMQQESLLSSNDDGKSATFLLHADNNSHSSSSSSDNNNNNRRTHHPQPWLWCKHPKKKASPFFTMAFIVLVAVILVTICSVTVPAAHAFVVQPQRQRPFKMLRSSRCGWQRMLSLQQQQQQQQATTTTMLQNPFQSTTTTTIRHRTWLRDTETPLTAMVTTTAATPGTNLTETATTALRMPSSSSSSSNNNNNNNDDDVPMPTENGGYSHTSASKAKISAANRGNTPWNKGRTRSPQERARIAAGVRAKNRQRFLEQLAAQNMTESEYNAQKAAERQRQADELSARRTAKGGYRPTAATRQKISRILKEKHAAGQVKRRPVSPDKVRRGFTHSDETRRKISQSLKRKWATDHEYRQNILEKTSAANARQDTRDKISAALRRKWQDEGFRREMLQKIAARRRTSPDGPVDEEYRQRISAAMKLKWQDQEYRTKTLQSIAKRNRSGSSRKRKPASKHKGEAEAKTAQPRVVAKQTALPKVSNGVATSSSSSSSQEAQAVQQSTTTTRSTTTISSTSKIKGASSSDNVTPLRPRTVGSHGTKKAVQKKRKKIAKKKKATEAVQAGKDKNDKESKDTAKKEVAPDGSEIRRDLYDLLYGDDEEASRVAATLNSATSRLPNLVLNDENLDSFDPYGLDDF